VSPAARLLLLPVAFYRRWISPGLPAHCRFSPSCSAYAVDALRAHGALRGSWLTVRRLARCHPFHPGGHDPVPAARSTSETMSRRPATRSGAPSC
jgi:putative membrane protein insertion efficiency factor